MNVKFLFPHSFKQVGYMLFIPGIILGILFLIYHSEIDFFNTKVFAVAEESFFRDPNYFSFIEDNLLNELASILIIVGGLLISFSKEKVEDEFIAKIRLESLVWATFINYGILILAILFVFNMSFLWVLVFNMFTLLIVFIIRFHWALFTFKQSEYEEQY